MGMKKGASALWYSELSLHQLGSRPTVLIPRWTTHPCILYRVCATRGAAVGVRARNDQWQECEEIGSLNSVVTEAIVLIIYLVSGFVRTFLSGREHLGSRLLIHAEGSTLVMGLR